LIAATKGDPDNAPDSPPQEIREEAHAQAGPHFVRAGVLELRMYVRHPGTGHVPAVYLQLPSSEGLMETPIFVIKAHKPQGKCGECNHRIKVRDSYWKWRNGRYGGYEVRCVQCGPDPDRIGDRR
jgi:hypothetical protein